MTEAAPAAETPALVLIGFERVSPDAFRLTVDATEAILDEAAARWFGERIADELGSALHRTKRQT